MKPIEKREIALRVMPELIKSIPFLEYIGKGVGPHSLGSAEAVIKAYAQTIVWLSKSISDESEKL